jgi:hypothetical protein
MMELTDRLRLLAQQQFGVLSRQQLTAHLSASVVDGYVRRGTVTPLARGVYRMTSLVDLPEQAPIAAALRAGPGAVVTGPFVLGLLKVDGFDVSDPFEILVPPGRRLRHSTFPVRADPFPTRTVTKRGEVRIAAPVDGLIESSLWRPEVDVRRLRVAYHQPRWKGVLTTAKVERRLGARGPDDPAGVAFLEAVGDLAPESEGEHALAPSLTRLRPTPKPQVWVTPKRRVDWYLAALRFGWEYVGGVDHAYPDRRQADAIRDDELVAQGIQLQYVTAADLEHPEAFLAATMEALVTRATRLGVQPPRLARP